MDATVQGGSEASSCPEVTLPVLPADHWLHKDVRWLGAYYDLCALRTPRASQARRSWGRAALAARWAWTDKQVRYFLAKLASDPIALPYLHPRGQEKGHANSSNGNGMDPAGGQEGGHKQSSNHLTRLARNEARVEGHLERAVTSPVLASLTGSGSVAGESKAPDPERIARLDPDERQRLAVERVAAELCAAVNRGLDENPLVDSPLRLGGHWPKSQDAAREVIAARVGMAFARSYCYQQGMTFKPTERHPEVGSLKYLLRGLVRAWEQSAEKRERDLAAAGLPAPGTFSADPGFGALVRDIPSKHH